jgi:hypothetical protein
VGKSKKEKEMTEKELLYELNELAEDILTPTDLLQSINYYTNQIVIDELEGIKEFSDDYVEQLIDERIKYYEQI